MLITPFGAGMTGQYAPGVFAPPMTHAWTSADAVHAMVGVVPSFAEVLVATPFAVIETVGVATLMVTLVVPMVGLLFESKHCIAYVGYIIVPFAYGAVVAVIGNCTVN